MSRQTREQRRNRQWNRWPALAIAGAMLLGSLGSSGCDTPNQSGRVTPTPVRLPARTYLNKFLVKRSPAGAYEATFYNFGESGDGYLGATVSGACYVNVRPAQKPFDPKQGQVFAMRHGYQVRLTWDGEKHLRIDYPDSADVEKKASRSGTVSVSFQRASL